MQTIVAALSEQQAELADLLADLDEADWQRPSYCEGWTVSDVVLHLAQTDEMAIGSTHGEFGATIERLATGLGPASSVDDGADLMVAKERGASAAAVFERWRRGTQTLDEAFLACDPHDRLVWVAGELSARSLATTRLAETWIHTGDIGFAFGRSPEPTGRLWHVARLAWRTLPYAFARAGRQLSGPVTFELSGPNGEVWEFAPDAPALTTVTGDAVDLCWVAGQRAHPRDTSLRATGPDAAAALELVRTFA
jgi:uncharacterized protein (TIGR03084 family)